MMPATSPVDVRFQDFWNRNWVFCDHMISAIHLDALRFALLRRNRDHDNEFDSCRRSENPRNPRDPGRCTKLPRSAGQLRRQNENGSFPAAMLATLIVRGRSVPTPYTSTSAWSRAS